MSHSVSVLNESFFIRAKTVTLPGHFKCHLMNFQFGSIRGPLKRNHAFSPPNLSVLGTILTVFPLEARRWAAFAIAGVTIPS